MNHQFLPNNEESRREMLESLGLSSIEELFGCCIPENVRFKGSLDLPKPLSELEARRLLTQIANVNKPVSQMVSFLGGGVADHYIPAAVDHILSRSEFYTAYTPYQAEVSQGTLQNIFEFQTLICMLTGMDVANASMYDGASALAEAVLMASSATRQDKIVISQTVNPQYRETVQTYADATGLEIVEIPHKDGQTDLDAMEKAIDDKTAAIAIQNPNFFGIIEDPFPISKLKEKGKKTLLISVVDPLSLGVIVPPGDYDCDIALGEGQPLGNPISFGGPHLGFFAAKENLIRRMPGRLIGQTKDVDGKRGFVMTLQTREQHIRRHRATSNICTNQALNALGAASYLNLMGKEGIQEVAQQCLQKANYLKDKIEALPGYSIPFNGPVFKEFAVKANRPFEEIQKVLVEKGFLPGIHLQPYYDGMDDWFLVCVTEKRTREEMDRFAAGLEGV